MIDPKFRFFIIAEIVTGTQHTSHIIDWEQRRWYAINGSTKFLPPEGGLEIDILKHYVDHLAPSVRSITVDDEGLLVSVSSDSEDDPTLSTYYPRHSRSPSLQNCSLIDLSKLIELDRLGPQVDLVCYTDESGVQKKVVFKYYVAFQWMERTWMELHLVKSLPAHPYIVPFDRLVVEGPEFRILGFTTPYIPGGTLDENKSRAFRLEWLHQLMAVVDYLNLKLGIVHQDIAPRNLLIDPETNNLQIFDFNRAAFVGQKGCIPELNDVDGVIFTLYEIITHDEHFRMMTFTEFDPETVLNLQEWPVHSNCQLDNDIALFRKHLEAWVQQRRESNFVAHAQQIDVSLDIPDRPPPTPILTGYHEDGGPIYRTVLFGRLSALKFKHRVLSWERLLQRSCSGLEAATENSAV